MKSYNTRKGLQRVLVTGGAGFIGSHLVRAYLASGREVWVADNLSTGRAENVPADARLVTIDIADARAVGDLMEEGRFDLVNHQAAQVDIRVSVRDPQRDARTNVLGLLNVAQAAADTGVGRFLFASSGGAIYGEVARKPAREGDAKNPQAPYGIAKYTGELYLSYFAGVRNLEYVALRYGNVYGSGQDPAGEAGVVAIFCGNLSLGSPLKIFGDGSQERDYVHVSDVTKANLLLSDADLPGAAADDEIDVDRRAFNVSTGVPTSVSELAETLEEITGRQVGRVFAPERGGELQRSVLDPSKLKKMGWEPTRTLSDGLAHAWSEMA